MRYAFALYFLMSLVSLIAYKRDKTRAEKGRWRTQERTLLMIDLFCGWPGGFAAQRLFHHKNRKIRYQIGFCFVTALNVVTVAGLLRGALALD